MKKPIKLKSSKNISVKVRLGVAILAALLYFVLAYYCKPIKHLNDDLCDLVYQQESGYQLPVCIIGIDDETLDKLGLPEMWSRQVYADLLKNICSEQCLPSVVAFDICFTGEKDSEGDISFANKAADYGHVVSALNVLFEEKIEYDEAGHAVLNTKSVNKVIYPYNALAQVTNGGFVDPLPDDDNYIRKLITYVNNPEGGQIDSFSLAVLKEFAKATGKNIADYNSQNRTYYDFKFSSKPGVIEKYSFYDVYLGKIPAEYFDGAIVLVGAYASGLQDDFYVPISSGQKMYGVEIHANMIMALLENKIQTRPDGLTVTLIEAVLFVGVGLFLLLGLSFAAGIIISGLVVLIYFIVCLALYKNGIYMDLFYFPAAVVLANLGNILYHYISEYFSVKRIQKAFKMYVAPEVVEELSKDGSYNLKLSGVNKDVAVLFVDIRGFTTMSETLDPSEVVAILNDYFEVVTESIFKNRGTLDKFIGDAAMAVFNSPFDLEDYEFRAVKTAWDIRSGAEGLALKLKEKYGKTVSFGIGVNCGMATIGNIGSNFRMDFTAIGDTVNTAARLESNAKPGEILISDELRKRLGDRIETEDVGEIPLKGKQKSVFVYRVTSVK